MQAGLGWFRRCGSVSAVSPHESGERGRVRFICFARIVLGSVSERLGLFSEGRVWTMTSAGRDNCIRCSSCELFALVVHAGAEMEACAGGGARVLQRSADARVTDCFRHGVLHACAWVCICGAWRCAGPSRFCGRRFFLQIVCGCVSDVGHCAAQNEQP